MRYEFNRKILSFVVTPELFSMEFSYRRFSRDVTAAKSCKSRYSQQPCWIFFALSGIGESHRICSHSLLLNLHKAKLHRSNNVINTYSLTASLTCSNKISKKLKHILLFFPGFSIPRHAKKQKQKSNMASSRSAHEGKPSIERLLTDTGSAFLLALQRF